MSTVRYSLSGATLALAALVAGSAALLAPAALQAAPSKPAVHAAAKSSAPAAAKPEQARAAAKGAKAARKGKGAEKGPKLAAASEPQYTSSLAGAQPEDDNCQRIRRKLWVDGEGWIVRRVAICH